MNVRAFAKINLSLRVVGTRPDGFHELETIFQSIALHDTLTLRRARGPLRFECDDPACPAGSANLVVRAASAAWKASGRRGSPRDVAIALTKRIPLAAGLGGGSSDAAAALRALARLWSVDARSVPDLAASLGADVPYFLEGGTALGLARGDVLTPLDDFPRAWVTLVVPSFGVSTKEAFAWWDSAKKGYGPFFNDLEGPVAARHPEIARVVSALQHAGATHAAMTGSGSTVFGLFASRTGAIHAAQALRSPARRCIVTRTVARAEYRRLAAK